MAGAESERAERRLRRAAVRGLPRRARKRPRRVAPDLRGQRRAHRRRDGGRADRSAARSRCRCPHPARRRPAAGRRRRRPPVDAELLGGVAAAMALVKAYRMHGHLAARLDPLGSEPMGDPALDETRLHPPLTPGAPGADPREAAPALGPGRDAARRAPPPARGLHGLDRLRDRAHLRPRGARLAPEGDRVGPLPPGAPSRASASPFSAACSQVEGFEQYLRRSFLGQKQFSLEGLDALVPMLDETIELAAEGGAHEVVIGMAHRGRLNALVHTVGRSYESVLREFEGERSYDALVVDPEGGSGDVKYHLPASGTRRDRERARSTSRSRRTRATSRRSTRSSRAGRAPSRPTARAAPRCTTRPSRSPILIHGDAAFPGQGVVAETFNLQSLEGYSTGGTLHLITNNQVGFTTDPAEGRSTRYSSDLAKGFDVPIVHVNADDPEAALSAVRLALAYRAEFGHDFVIDLVGYRRFGHQEQDEAAYTQPLQVERIEPQPTVREQYAARLVEEGVVTPEEADAILEDVVGALRAAHDRLRASIAEPPAPPREPAADDRDGRRRRDRRRRRAAARRSTSSSSRVPAGFTVHPKLARQLERRRETIRQGGIDWGQAEALAFASLLEDGIPIRLSGQDTERGHLRAPAPRPPRPAHGRDRRPDPAPARARTPRSRSTTRRSRSTRRSGSSTATRSRLRTRSCSGRRSSATSSTARRS